MLTMDNPLYKSTRHRMLYITRTLYQSDEIPKNALKLIAYSVSKRFGPFHKLWIYFLTRYFMSWTHNSAKKQSWSAHFAIVAKESFSILQGHHSWSVTSCEREGLPLWRNIRRLFVQAQIGTKAIFTSEQQPWISISHYRVFTAYNVRK